MKNPADRSFTIAVVIVLVCSFFMEQSIVTNLAMVVILGAHSLLTLFVTEQFLQKNMWVVMLGTAAINGVIFAGLVFPFWMILRRERATLCSVLIVTVLAVYLALMFFLFPATDGP